MRKQSPGLLVVGVAVSLAVCDVWADRTLQSQSGLDVTPMEAGFKNPPSPARPGIMWQWMGGNVSKEAITADLEAMNQAGITDVIVFSDIALGCPQGSVAFMSEEWKTMIRWAAAEAERLGIGLRFHNCPGWSTSGGPWIEPQDSMQMVVESETYVHGPASVNIRLPQPPAAHGHYEDIAVLAIPVSAPDGSSLIGADPRITSNIPGFHSEALSDESLDTAVPVKYGEGAGQSQIDFQFEKPYPVRSFWMIAKPAGGSGKIELQSSSDGVRYDTVAKISAPGVPVSHWLGSSFSPVVAKYYGTSLFGVGISTGIFLGFSGPSGRGDMKQGAHCRPLQTPLGGNILFGLCRRTNYSGWRWV